MDYPELPGPCPSGYLPSWLYEQSEWWLDEDGRRLALDELDLGQLLEAMNRIEARGPQDWRHEIGVELRFVRLQREAGEKASFEWVRRLISQGPEEWLRTSSLYRALQTRADRLVAV